MANQSFINIPPNIEDPTVLRRVLTRLSEQVDTLFGARSGAESTYIDEKTLTELTDSLNESIEEAKVILKQAAEVTEASVQQSIEALENQVKSLQSSKVAKGLAVSFTVDGSGDPDVQFSSNIGTMANTATGVYTLTHSVSFDTISSSFEASRGLTISIARTSATLLTISVFDAGVLSDLAVGELVDITALIGV